MSEKPRFLFLFLLGLGWLVSTAPGLSGVKGREEKPLQGGTLRIKPFSGALNVNLDPARETETFLMEQMFDGLVRLDKDLNVTPALAEYWTISPDGRTYTFFLRRGVKFHNGRELASEDIKFSLERLLDPKQASPYADLFVDRVAGAAEFRSGRASGVSGFRSPDRHTFEIRWNRPYVSGLYLLSMPYCKALPRDLVRSQGSDFFWKPVGTGPFRFAHWLRSPRLEVVGLRLERNPGYFASRPHLSAIEYSPFYTLDHFRDREVDIIPFVSEGLSGTDCSIRDEGSLEVVLLGMSCHLAPLDKPAVRRALAMAVDRGRIARVSTTSESLPQLLQSFVPPRLPGFFPADEDWRTNIAEARILMEREGFSGRKPFPPLALFVRADRREAAYRLYRELRDQLRDLGIRLSLRTYRRDGELQSVRNPYLVLIERRMEFPDADGLLRPLFHSRSAQNLTRYANPRFDKILEEADVERSWSGRLEMLRKAERLLAADLPGLPLFSPAKRMAIQPHVRGVEVPALGFSYLNTLKIWVRKRG